MTTKTTPRTIDWVDGAIEIIDQTLLPGQLEVLHLTRYEELIDAIQRLAVRGAPALGVAGALGVALIAADPRFSNDLDAQRRAAADVENARPTAVNLAWGARAAIEVLDEGADAVLGFALSVRDDEIFNSTEMGRRGLEFVESILPSSLTIMTICNTGALAAVERGTALGLVRTLHEAGRVTEVISMETRPLLQGARLTAWELSQLDIPFRLAVDSAGPFLLSQGGIDLVVVGADRIAANGDTANKVGTYSLAVAAARNNVPFVVVAPESTVDVSTPVGHAIEIEDRGPAEVVSFRGVPTAPDGTQAVNPAFDVTPADLIAAIVTQRRVIRPGRGERPSDPIKDN